MIHSQFDVLVTLLRGQPDSAANIAARLVLVEGQSQAEAVRFTGATRSTVADAVKRYRDANNLIRSAFTACMYASRGVQYPHGKSEGLGMKVELKVSKHPSGRLTLTERAEGDKLPKDCTGPLLGNSDAAEFYKAVAKKIANLHTNGFDLTYSDNPQRNSIMTREDVMLAVNKVFGVNAWAVVGFWNVHIDTTPKREIIFTADWVRTHIDSETSTLTPDELEEQLQMLSGDDWHDNKETGTQFCVIR